MEQYIWPGKNEKYDVLSLNHLGAILVVALRLARTTRVSRDRREVSGRTFLLIFGVIQTFREMMLLKDKK